MADFEIFAWNIFLEGIKGDIKKESDIIVAAAHFVLSSEGFRCLGIGDDVSSSDFIDVQFITFDIRCN